MGRSANQKRKILLIERMLMEADESSPIAMREILERLAQDGIQAERKSVYADLEELRAVGMEICFRKGRPAGYYPVSKNVRLMQMKKAAEEMGGQTAEEKCGEVRLAEDLSEEKQSAEDAIGKSGQEWPDGIRSWEQPEKEYREIQLRCKKSALSVVTGRYGENCKVLKEDEKQVLVAVAEAPGNSFYGWLVAQGGAVRPVKPKETAKEYRKLLKKILESYK